MRKILLATIICFTFQLSYGQAELKEDFDKAVELLRSENYNNAVKLFSDILVKATDKELKKFCFIYRAFSYNGLRDYRNAIPDLDSAILLDPTDLASFTDRGKTKAYAGDLEGSKNDFLFILGQDSVGGQGQAAIYYLGKIEYRLANYEESIKYYDRLIMLTPRDAELYFNRGAAKGMLMDPQGAIEDYDKAIRYKPDYMEAYANRGVSRINLLTKSGNIQPTKEQTSDACSDLKRAKQLGDDTVDDMIFVYCDKK